MNSISVNYRNNKLNFLIDTGASTSIIFKHVLFNSERINKNDIIKFHGINSSSHSIGSTSIKFSLANANIQHKFSILNDNYTGSHGILGTDFFSKYKANIDYKEFKFKFSLNNKEFTTNLTSNQDVYTIIPARCEVIKYFHVDTQDDCVILPENISKGVYTAAGIATPKQGKIPIKLLNTTEEEIKIRNFTPSLHKLGEYNVYDFQKQEISVERVDKLLDIVRNKSLNTEEQLEIDKICAKYADVFHMDGDPVSVTNVGKYTMQLKEGTAPIYRKPYRLPHMQKSEVHKQVDQMLKDGIIEESKSLWNSPLLIVPKKSDSSGNRKYRVVIDYRLLNKQLEDEKFPLPNITDILDSLSGAVYFSHLDMSQGFYQVELDEDSRKYTAFSTDKARYQMTRLPMGTKVSPQAFSKIMNVAMSGLNPLSCFIYLDDLIIFGNNLQTHNTNLIKVLQRLRDVNLKLNPHKCNFLKKELLYLGHIVTEDGIKPDPSKITAIKDYPVPKTAKETKRFVAFANYYRRFIKDFAKMVRPLNNLSKKTVKFVWDNNCQEAFETLRNALTNPPVLQYPNFAENNTFILRTDASAYAVGATLSNSDDKPIAYASRSLNQAEINYSVTEKELTAAVWAVKHFRPYLFGRKFELLTDHKALIYLFSMVDPSSRLTKFRLKLEEYDYVVKYVKGSSNVTADCLSRITSDELKQLSTSNCFVVTRNQAKLKVDNKRDVDTSRTDHPGLVEILNPNVESIELRVLGINEFNKLVYKLGKEKDIQILKYIIYDKHACILYILNQQHALGKLFGEIQEICTAKAIKELFIVKSDKNNNFINSLAQFKDKLTNLKLKISIIKGVKTVDDEELQQIILNDFHILPTGGHAGINRMYNNIKKYYFWIGLKRQIKSFVSKCNMCQTCKHSKIRHEPLTVTTTATSAFHKIFLDIVGPLPQDDIGNRYILTLQCDLSKFIEGYAIPTKEAATVAKVFVDNFILRFGVPAEVVTDQGTEFMATTFQEICKLLGIKHLNSTAYHHETIGALENNHKHLNSYLRIQTGEHPNNWSSWIPYWCFTYNTTVHTETHFTPYELVFGKHVFLPSNVTQEIEPIYNFDNYPIELKYRLQSACEHARQNLILSKEKRKSFYDNNNIVNRNKYNVGDKILLKDNPVSKLQKLYSGPFKVIEDISPNVKIKVNDKVITVHKNRTKFFHE